MAWSLAALLGLIAASGPARAADIALELPVHCRPGTDCWVVNYVDLDPGPGTRDFACGVISYNGHKGVDVAVRDWAEVRKGVPARAAAAGTVLRVRDGVDDKAEPPKGQECGNGIVVDHGRGWTTQYCHLRRDSIVVKSGQPVRAGDALGMIGQSGRADFPHVHLQVARDGKIIDPFKGEGAPLGGCGLGQGHLWSAAALSLLTPHKPTAVFNSGIAAEEPDPAKARDGAYAGAVLRADAAILAVWADIYWAMAGDAVRLRMLSPAGAVLAEATRAVELTQARRFLYVGLRRKDAAWPAGVYKFEIVVLRTKDGAAGEISRRTGQAEVR